MKKYLCSLPALFFLCICHLHAGDGYRLWLRNPYGPFTYKGVVLNPVEGWTNHHSIVEVKGKWYLFYHDTQLSGKTHLRNVKVTEPIHTADGTITPVTAYQ